jgi:hypothetical protein
METSSTYTVIRGPLADSELALAHLPKSKRATEKESLEEGTARKKKVLGGRSSYSSSLAAGEDGEIVIDERTGERKNTRTGEYEW